MKNISRINANFRKSLIRRVDGICAICLKRPYSLEAHRIVPGSEKGKYTEENTIMVCRECHSIISKQPGLRRFLVDLRNSLEMMLSQHRLPGKKVKIKEIRESWECRRIKSSKDPLLESTFELFREFREGENEDPKSVGIWLDDMITWRRICTGLLNLCKSESIELDLLFNKLQDIMDYDEDDPRCFELHTALKSVKTKDELHTFIMNEILRLEDYLIVQRDYQGATGFVYFQYYYKHKFVFISYIALAKNEKHTITSHSLDRLVFNGLLKNLIRNHPECRGILMEVDPGDEPLVRSLEKAISEKLQNYRGRGLYRLLHRQYPLIKLININYIQPKSFIHSKRNEKDLWLLYYPIKSTTNDFITKRSLSIILDCVYNYVYRDELDNLEEFNSDIYLSYSNYLNGLKTEIIKQSPEKVPLI